VPQHSLQLLPPISLHVLPTLGSEFALLAREILLLELGVANALVPHLSFLGLVRAVFQDLYCDLEFLCRNVPRVQRDGFDLRVHFDGFPLEM
jgi:hypothetical protein